MQIVARYHDGRTVVWCDTDQVLPAPHPRDESSLFVAPEKDDDIGGALDFYHVINGVFRIVCHPDNRKN